MRHRKRGRVLGRSPSHRRALLRNLASALFLTERDDEVATLHENKPKVRGRIITTLAKAKEVRPLVERCITIARRSLEQEDAARQLEPEAERGTTEWQKWRKGKQYRQWNEAIAPTVAARRRVLRLLGSREAMQILFDDIAPRFAERPGGYTRILRLANPRLGDAGPRAVLELVGTHDRVVEKSQAPAVEEEPEPAAEAEEKATAKS